MIHAIVSADSSVVLWLNQWVGTFPLLDDVMKVLISDYFVPVFFSIVLLGLWFTGPTRLMREINQRGVLLAASSMGVVNIWVKLINLAYFRPRPFVHLDINLLFYRPTDSSFPANPAAVAFAAAFGIWLVNRKLGAVMFIFSGILTVGRVYAGIFYPSDIIGGALLGIATVFFMKLVFKLGEPLPSIFLRVLRTLCLA